MFLKGFRSGFRSGLKSFRIIFKTFLIYTIA